jgi:hypothetical protein
LFLLPGGRPRRLGCLASHAGGLPLRGPLPRANCSRLTIAFSICSRSWRKSAMTFVTSIFSLHVGGNCVPKTEQCSKNRTICLTIEPLKLFYRSKHKIARTFCSESRTIWGAQFLEPGEGGIFTISQSVLDKNAQGVDDSPADRARRCCTGIGAQSADSPRACSRIWAQL